MTSHFFIVDSLRSLKTHTDHWVFRSLSRIKDRSTPGMTKSLDRGTGITCSNTKMNERVVISYQLQVNTNIYEFEIYINDAVWDSFQ